jgi:hypothetical protein
MGEERIHGQFALHIPRQGTCCKFKAELQIHCTCRWASAMMLDWLRSRLVLIAIIRAGGIGQTVGIDVAHTTREWKSDAVSTCGAGTSSELSDYPWYRLPSEREEYRNTLSSKMRPNCRSAYSIPGIINAEGVPFPYYPRATSRPPLASRGPNHRNVAIGLSNVDTSRRPQAFGVVRQSEHFSPSSSARFASGSPRQTKSM